MCKILILRYLIHDTLNLIIHMDSPRKSTSMAILHPLWTNYYYRLKIARNIVRTGQIALYEKCKLVTTDITVKTIRTIKAITIQTCLPEYNLTHLRKQLEHKDLSQLEIVKLNYWEYKLPVRFLCSKMHLFQNKMNEQLN